MTEKKVLSCFENTNYGLMLDIIYSFMPKNKVFESFDEERQYILENFERIFTKSYWFRPRFDCQPQFDGKPQIKIILMDDFACINNFQNMPSYVEDILKKLKAFPNVHVEIMVTVTPCDKEGCKA